MLSHVQTFCELILAGDSSDPNGWTGIRNMRDWCGLLLFLLHFFDLHSMIGTWLAFDISGDFVFGHKFRTLSSAETRFVVTAIMALNVRSGTYAQSPGLANLGLDILWCPIDRDILRKVLQWRRDIGELLTDPGQKETANSLFARVLDAKDEVTGSCISHMELMAEAQVLLVAGKSAALVPYEPNSIYVSSAFETTATTLSAIFFYLSHNPTAYTTLAHEIRHTFHELDDIKSGPQLNSCRYLTACIQEAMRMSPAAAGAMWREAEAGGIHVDGEFIPEGYDVGTCIYAIHHNETYFPDSFTFAPERWLPSYSDNDGSGKPSQADHAAYSPFSTGPRACIGRAFAMMEISITVARVLWLMDFRVSGRHGGSVGEGGEGMGRGRRRVGEFQLYSHLTSYAPGPMLEFRRRRG